MPFQPSMRTSFFSSLGSPVTLQKLQRTPQKCIFQRFLEMTETRGRKGGKKRKFDLGGVHRQKCQLESLEEGQWRSLGGCGCYQERVDQCSNGSDAWVHTGTSSTASSRKLWRSRRRTWNYGIGRGHGGKACVSNEGMCGASWWHWGRRPNPN